MLFEILDESYDYVIKSVNITVKADYEFAIARLIPLINKLDFQRSPLRKTFYARLERDIIKGCIMPFLTIAIKQKDIDFPFHAEDKKDNILSMLSDAFVLDGIQRLNTLSGIAKNAMIDLSRPIFFNILICDSMDRLLYRMVTLNNGQRPMTARHQIEMLANNMFDYQSMPILAVTEKQVKAKTIDISDDVNTMAKDTIIKAYMAFISNSVNIDNQKIIESKMDELITEQIMESNITDRETQYIDVMTYVNKCISDDAILKAWFDVQNNFIGFTAAMSKTFSEISRVDPSLLRDSVVLFDKAFGSISVSKIKLGMARRRMVQYFFENYDKLSILDENKLLDKISMEL